jgi:hypothetical protein
VCPHIFFFSFFPHFFFAAPNMADSDSSVHGGHHGDREPPVSRDEMRHMADSLMEAMGRLLDERLPVAGGRRARRDQERSPAMRILVLAMDSIASEMALKDLVVVAMLILIITMVGVAHIGVMLMVAACILKTKSLKIKIMKKDLMMMKILSVKVAGLIGVIIAGLLILKKGNTIVVVILMTTQITSLVSS